MAKRLGSVYVPKTSARVVQRPDSIPGMEDTPATVSVTVSQTAVSVTGTGPVTRSTSTISHSATPSLNSLSPDGYELTDAVNICGPEGMNPFISLSCMISLICAIYHLCLANLCPASYGWTLIFMFLGCPSVCPSVCPSHQWHHAIHGISIFMASLPSADQCHHTKFMLI